MKFLNKIIRTSVDFEGYNSLLIHSLVGCNFKCYGCHNYDELIEKEQTSFFSAEDIINKIKLNGFMFDAIILSGGEFLLNNIGDIKDFLINLRQVFDGKIMINTNGSQPAKISTIIIMDLADGFFMDLKYNIWDENDIFKNNNIGCNIKDGLLKASFYLVKNNDKGYSEFRTIKYPYIEDSYFDKIKEKCLSEGIIWKLNEFIGG